MKLLYTGASFCDIQTLKRLFLLAEELTFMDRPSVTFNDWGTVGHDSYARRFDWTGSPVPVSVLVPPSGSAAKLYRPYIDADLKTPGFSEVLLRGLQQSDGFASKFISLGSDYGNGMKGADILNALRSDPQLIDNLTQIDPPGPRLFEVATPEDRKKTFNLVAVNASIEVTSALIAAEERGLIPISEDPAMAQLLALRSSDTAYVGSTAKIAPYLGLSIARAIIPDSLMEHLSLPDLIKYREKAKDAYAAWTIEINRIAAQISTAGSVLSEDEIVRIIATDLKPKLFEYENDMRKIRDDLFGDVMKRVAQWEVPSLTLAHVSGFGAAAYFAAAVAPAIPGLVDYFKGRRDAQRRNAMIYLLGLSKQLQKDPGDI